MPRSVGRREIDGLAGTKVNPNAFDMDVTARRCGYFFTKMLIAALGREVDQRSGISLTGRRTRARDALPCPS
ncbi:hypothetical protein GCM10009859_02850 [Kocuria salsicia]